MSQKESLEFLISQRKCEKSKLKQIYDITDDGKYFPTLFC